MIYFRLEALMCLNHKGKPCRRNVDNRCVFLLKMSCALTGNVIHPWMICCRVFEQQYAGPGGISGKARHRENH